MQLGGLNPSHTCDNWSLQPNIPSLVEKQNIIDVPEEPQKVTSNQASSVVYLPLRTS